MLEGTSSLRFANGVELDVLDEATVAEHGDLLAGHEYDDCPELADWLLIQREHCRNMRRTALSARTDEYEREGRFGEALVAARELLRVNPESEDMHRRVISFCHVMGDHAGALRALTSQLGVQIA